MEPIVDGLEGEFGDQMAFERRNAVTEEGKAVMAGFSLRGHPSYAIVSPDGEHLWSAMGAMPAVALRAEVEQFAQ